MMDPTIETLLEHHCGFKINMVANTVVAVHSLTTDSRKLPRILFRPRGSHIFSEPFKDGLYRI